MPVKRLVLDTAPFIKGTNLRGLAEEYYTLPEVLAEIRDATSREMFAAQYGIDLKVRQPTPESIKAVIEFSKKTGDFPVLSKTDLLVLALVHTIEVEANGKDLIRTSPGEVLKKPAAKKETPVENLTEKMQTLKVEDATKAMVTPPESSDEADTTEKPLQQAPATEQKTTEKPAEVIMEDDDEGDWITPSTIGKQANKNKKKKKNKGAPQADTGCMTADFAMQVLHLLLKLESTMISESTHHFYSLRTCFFK